MNTRGLAESIILQSFEDLWYKNYRKDSEIFFKSDAFRHCAEIAGINPIDQIKLLNIVDRIIENLNKQVRHLKIEKKIA